jgi:GT2 family glycosyltransferase
MLIKVLMITHNRPDYTKLSLERLCSTAPKNLKVTIWDNGSDSETRNILKKYEGHPCVEQVVYNEKNELLRRPTNWFWNQNLEVDLLGKVDDDCLIPENWCFFLEKAHRDIPQAGVLACWHYLPQDFNYELAKKKIQTYGNHQIMRNCWVGGSGYLMKREVIDKIGLLRPKESFTTFCIRASAKGFINGWYYPFLYQKHMDDPRVSSTGIRTEEDFKNLFPLTANNFEVKTREQWIEWLKEDARRLQECSINPYDFIGFRARVKRKFKQVLEGYYFGKVNPNVSKR